MIQEETITYINTQLACAMIDCAAMQVANTERLLKGESIAYNEEAFRDLIIRYNLHHNSVVTQLRR